MTPEEKAANVALLAERVMGWSETGFLTYPRFGIVAGFPSVCRSAGENFRIWHPYTSIADAMEMLEKFDTWSLNRSDKEFFVCYLPFNANDDRPEDQTICDAICAACLEWARVQGEKG